MLGIYHEAQKGSPGVVRGVEEELLSLKKDKLSDISSTGLNDI